MLIQTKGRARQKAFTLARQAGVELKAVTFSKKETEEAISFKLRGKKCTPQDPYLGRAFIDSKVIWLHLPTRQEVIAHEVMHLRTKTSHSAQSFKNQTVALSRGLNPEKAKAQYYDVTVTIVSTYRVYELSPSAAKKHFQRGERIALVKTLNARREKNP